MWIHWFIPPLIIGFKVAISLRYREYTGNPKIVTLKRALASRDTDPDGVCLFFGLLGPGIVWGNYVLASINRLNGGWKVKRVAVEK